MARDRSLVRASDIGFWTFCNRAWWLSTVEHAEHENPTVLERGNRAHRDHGRALDRARTLNRLGAVLVGGGIVLLVLWLALWLALR